MRSHTLRWNFLPFTMLATALLCPRSPVRAQPPELAKAWLPLSGHVVRNARNGEFTPVAGAVITIFWLNDAGWDQRDVMQLRTDANGDFNTQTLPPQLPNGSWIIVARAPETANAPAAAPLNASAISLRPAGAELSNPPARLTLGVATPLTVRVTDSKNQPVAGVAVRVDKIRIAEDTDTGSFNSGDYWRRSMRWNPTATVTTDDDGVATLLDLPATGAIQLIAHHEDKTDGDFADNVVRQSLPSDKTLPIILPRATTIEGRVLLGSGPDARPLSVPKWRLKMQGWNAQWAQYDNWRMSYFDQGGQFKIVNVPSLEVLGEPTYSANIDFDGVTNPAPGVTGTYAPPNQGFNALVTVERDGKTERWISYVQGLGHGWKFSEGEQLQRDINFEPMALLRGQMTSEERPRIFYRDPKSIYSNWSVTPDAQGKFELSVPIGDVELHIGEKTLDVKNLQPHEERDIMVPQP